MGTLMSLPEGPSDVCAASCMLRKPLRSQFCNERSDKCHDKHAGRLFTCSSQYCTRCWRAALRSFLCSVNSMYIVPTTPTRVSVARLHSHENVASVPTRPQPPTTAYTHLSTRAGVSVRRPQAPEGRQLNDEHLPIVVSHVVTITKAILLTPCSPSMMRRSSSYQHKLACSSRNTSLSGSCLCRIHEHGIASRR